MKSIFFLKTQLFSSNRHMSETLEKKENENISDDGISLNLEEKFFPRCILLLSDSKIHKEPSSRPRSHKTSSFWKITDKGSMQHDHSMKNSASKTFLQNSADVISARKLTRRSGINSIVGSNQYSNNTLKVSELMPSKLAKNASSQYFHVLNKNLERARLRRQNLFRGNEPKLP